MQKKNWEVQGIEPDPLACEFARNKFGLNVILGTLETVVLEPAQFDVITLWHVLEHLHNPVDYLRICRRLLKPSGQLVVELPNFDCLQSRVFRNNWYALMVPEHLSHFSPRTLPVVLQLAGFENIQILHQFNRAGWGTSLRLSFSDLKHAFNSQNKKTSDGSEEQRSGAQKTVRNQDSIGSLTSAINQIGYFCEAKLLRFKMGTMNMRAICYKET